MKLILFITLLLNSFLSLASAREHITYLDFVTMEKADQREVIKMIQDFNTTSESVQNYYIFKAKGLKKKTTFINAIFNQFRAYAGSKGFDEPERNTCFYGGWLSQMYVNKTNTEKTENRYPICANPARLSYDSESGELNENIFTNNSVNDQTKFNEDSKEVAIESGEYYDELQKQLKDNQGSFTKITIDDDLEAGKFQVQLNREGKNVETGDPSEAACSVPDDIICNPMVYGLYKGGPFCVPKKSDDAYNTSFLCAKALEKVKEIDGEDEYNKTLDAAVDESIKRPRLFNNTLINLYDTCMCKGESYAYTDASYSRMVYNSRTCVAILNSTKNILSAIGRNNKCNEFETDNMGAVSDMAIFFNRAYKHVNSEVEELNNNYSLASIDTLYNGDRSKRYQEEHKIRAIRGPLDDLREQNQVGDDASKKACPISMDEDAKKVKILISGVPDLNTMTDNVVINFEVNGERVNLSDGDVSVKLKQVADKRGSSLVPGLNLNAITYINGSANFTAPMNYTQSYELEFEVSQNGNSDKGNYEVAQVAPVCDATFTETEDGKYNVEIKANRNIAGETEGAVAISEGISYTMKLGNDDIAFTQGQPLSLPEGADANSLKLFAVIDGVDAPLECNGQSFASDALNLSSEVLEAAELADFKHTFLLKLKKGTNEIGLALESPTAEQGQLSPHEENDSAKYSMSQEGDNVKVVATMQYGEEGYNLKFSATQGESKSNDLTIPVPAQKLVCSLSNKVIDGNKVSVNVSVKAGDKNLSSSLEQNVNIKIGDLSLSKSGDTESNTYFNDNVPDENLEDEISGTVSIASIGAQNIPCGLEETEDPTVDPIVDPVANNSCTIETKIDGSGDSVSIVAEATVTIDGEETAVINDGDLPDGYTFQWTRITDRAPAQTTDGMVSDDAGSRVEEAFGTTLSASVTRSDVEQEFTAIISTPEGEELCTSPQTVAKKSATTPTDTTPVAPTTYGTMPGQGPQPIPMHRSGGRMFRGNQ